MVSFASECITCGMGCQESRDGFRSDTHGNGFECHYLPYFNSNTDTNTNIVGYEYKTESSNSDLHSDTYLIWNIAS